MREHSKTFTGRRESGSAYVISLLALVVLTTLALVVATTTDVEMEVGANERVATRTFYGADSGVAIALAHVLVFNDYRSRIVDFYQGVHNLAPGLDRSRGLRVDVSNKVPILREPCNWCPVNENEQKFFKVNHLVVSTVTELSWPGTDEAPPNDAVLQAQKTISVMLEVQPWRDPPPESVPKDAAALKRVGDHM